jgi:hypothetical protein
MPTLASPLDLAKYEARNLRAHQLGSAPSSPVTGQMYYNNGDNTLYWWDGSIWVSARGGASATPQATTSSQGTIQLAGDLAGTATAPVVAALAITDAKVAAANKDGIAGTASMRTLGTGATQAAAGNDARLSDARAPSGVITGDLAGSTYPALNVANLAITAAKVANATLTDTQVAAANKDGVVGTASMRTLGSGAQQAMPGNRTLDAITAPVAPVGLNTQRISALAPSSVGTDAVNRNELDAARQGYAGAKDPVRVRTTTNVTIATPGATLDGIAMTVTDRVLLPAQTTGTQNGIYVWNGAAVPMTRALDADATGEILDGTTVAVADGTAQGTVYIQNAVASGAPGAWTQTWVQYNTVGTTYVAGAGLAGATTFDVVAGDTSLTVSADSLVVNTSVIASRAYADAQDLLSPLKTTALTAGAGLTGGGDLSAARTFDVVAGDTSLTVAADSVIVNTAVIAARSYVDTQDNLKQNAATAAGYYSALLAGTAAVQTVTKATHGLRASRGLIPQVQEEATGTVVLPDLSVAASGDVTVTFGATVAANAYRLTIVG